MATQPTSLQITQPDEGGIVALSWPDVPGAVGYIVERRYNEDFSTPAVGPSWENINSAEKSWGDIHNEDKTWAEREAEPTNLVIAQGPKSDFTIQNGIVIYNDFLKHLQQGLEKAAYRVSAYDANGVSEPIESDLLTITPACLHVPALHEGEDAVVFWRVMTGATAYVLERRWNEDFNAPATGSSWENIHSRDESWADMAAKNQSWADSQNASADFTIYEGPGALVPSPAQGQDWRDKDSAGKSWGEFEAMDLSWADSSSFLSRGMSWADHEATQSSWADMAKRNQSWGEMENAADANPHVSFTDVVQLGVKTASYRIKGQNAFGETTFFTHTPVKVIPILERDEEVSFIACTGERYRFALECTEIRRFQAGPLMNNQRIIMKIRYNPAMLTLTDFAAQTLEKAVSAGLVPGTLIDIRSHLNGEVHFTFNREIDGKEWASIITCFQFEALRNGKTGIRLS